MDYLSIIYTEGTFIAEKNERFAFLIKRKNVNLSFFPLYFTGKCSIKLRP